MKTYEMEQALWMHWARKGNKIMCLNVSWGMFNHECDMLVLNKDNTFTEVEIKVSKADLKKDLKKWHGHKDRRIEKLYFAIPERLENEEVFSLIPERAGIMVVYGQHPKTYITIRRKAKPQSLGGKPYIAAPSEIRKLAYLMQFRYWRERVRANALNEKLKSKNQLKLEL